MHFRDTALTLCIISVMQTCVGPDIGSGLSKKQSAQDSACSGCVTAEPVSVATPQIVMPFAGYRTTSNLVLVQLAGDSVADAREVAFYQGASLIYQTTVSAGSNVVTLPAGTVGLISVKARLIYKNTSGAYSALAQFTVENYAGAPILYAKNYNTASGCGDTNEPFGVRFFSGCGDSPWGALCPEAVGGGGNVWICNAGDYLGANNSSTGLYSANNAIFSAYNAPDGSVTATGYLQNASGGNDAMGISCREKNDGANNHYAMWIYPNRNALTTDNVFIVRHYPDNTNITLASGRFTNMQNKGAGSANAVTLRFECIGTFISVYYKNGSSEFVPLLAASDTSWTHSAVASFLALGVGPGAVVNPHARFTSLEIRQH